MIIPLKHIDINRETIDALILLHADYSNKAYWYNWEKIDALILLHADYSYKAYWYNRQTIDRCINIVTRCLFQSSEANWL